MSNIDKLKSATVKAVDNFDPNMFVETRDVLTLLDELDAAEKRIAEMESRTVTVKLPEVEKWRKPDAVRAQNAYRILIANELTDAGIQVIEGE